MALPHSDDESIEDRSKPADAAVNSSAATEDTSTSESEEKRTANATTKNISNSEELTALEEKDSEKTVLSKPQASTSLQIKDARNAVESKPEDTAVNSSATTEDISNFVYEEKRTANATTENTSNSQVSTALEEKKDEKAVGPKPQDNKNNIHVELEEEVVDLPTDEKSTSKGVSDNKMGAAAEGNPWWALVWLLILIFISFFVAGFCAVLYIFLSLFTPCIPLLYQVTDFLMKGINFVNYCSNNLILMEPLF